MNRIVAIAAAGLMLASAPAWSAQAGQSAQAREQAGKVVFDQWCSACHGPNPRLAGTLGLQTKYEGQIPAALEERTDLTPDIVASFVRGGVAWMAPFRKTEISDAELADLGAYLSKTPAQRRRK